EEGQVGTAIARVAAFGKDKSIFWGARAGLVGLVTRGAVAVAFVQDFGAKQVAAFEPRACEDPVVGGKHLIGGRGHGPGIGEYNAEQIRFRFDRVVKTALKARRPLIEATHRLARFKKLDLAVDAVAAEVEESSAALKDPALDG